MDLEKEIATTSTRYKNINDLCVNTLETKYVLLRKELIELIHSIRTPLASIKIGNEILKDFFPTLAMIYKNLNQHLLDKDIAMYENKLNKLHLIVENNLIEAKRISEYLNKIENHKLIQNKIEAINE